MPGEATHLSALADTLGAAPARVVGAIGKPGPGAARVGVMLVDLPYFHRFHWGLIRYLLGRPQAASPWGERFHQQAPIALGRRLVEGGARLRRSARTRDAGERLIALALGYISHAAVDSDLHPLVNQLARARVAKRGGGHLLREHQEVEKLQGVLYHQQRHGRDYLGTATLAAYIAIDWSMLWTPGPLADEVRRSIHDTLGAAPSATELTRWAAGYRLWVSVISGPLGRRAVSAAEKERERPALFDAVDYPGRFSRAVARSRLWTDALLAYADDGLFDDGARQELARIIPEQSLDP